MKRNRIYLVLLLAAVIAGGCTSPEEQRLNEISRMEDELFADASKMVDRNGAMELIRTYITFANDFPDDTVAAGMLFKAGDLAMNLNMPMKAIELFDRVMNEYPDFEKVPQCLFLKGYIYENDLKDLDKAREIYELFLEKFPDDDFADDAEICIRNLGKSAEDLIREFEEQMKKEAGDTLSED